MSEGARDEQGAALATAVSPSGAAAAGVTTGSPITPTARSMITRATRDLLRGDRDGWRERPGVAMKGKTEKVLVYAPG